MCFPVLRQEKTVVEDNISDNKEYSVIIKAKKREESPDTEYKHCASRSSLCNQTQVALASHRPSIPGFSTPFPNEGYSSFTNLHERMSKRDMDKENEYIIFRKFIFILFLILYACFYIFSKMFYLTILGNGDVELGRQLNQLAIDGNDAIPGSFQEYKRAGESSQAHFSSDLLTIKFEGRSLPCIKVQERYRSDITSASR